MEKRFNPEVRRWKSEAEAQRQRAETYRRRAMLLLWQVRTWREAWRCRRDWHARTAAMLTETTALANKLRGKVDELERAKCDVRGADKD